MPTDKQSTAHHFTYDVDENRDPSVSVIEAVAWIKGLQTEDLDPLDEAVDPNALDALFHPTKNGEPSVTFTYEGLEIQVDSEQHICIRGAADLIHGWLTEAANILLLAPTSHPHDDQACVDLLSVEPFDQANVLSVTFVPSAEDRLNVWQKHAGELPANTRIISVGDFTRSATARSTGSDFPEAPFQIDTVSDPSDIAELGIRVSEHLSAWEGNQNQTIMCFHSLTPLLQNADLLAVFRFLHVLSGRLSSAGAISHYHMDPSAHDEQTLRTIAPLFDVVIEVSENGEWSVRTP